MFKEEVFQVLGIGITKDEKLIKNAYREKLAVTNPEDDPEGFKRLRTAYEEACRIAREPDEEEEKQEEDTTPSGLWVKKAADIYNHISRRISISEWEELFKDDVYLSLEEEENCVEKLLVFFMDHFRLPSDIWKFIDKEVGITAKAPKLREKFPAEFISFIMEKARTTEEFGYEHFKGDEEANYDMFMHYHENFWGAYREEKYDQAYEYILSADELTIKHPAMELCRALVFVKKDRKEDAIAIVDQLYEEYGDDIFLLGHIASFYCDTEGCFEKAVPMLEKLKAENDKHYLANVKLSQYYYDCKRYKEAKKCAEKVLSSGADDAFFDLLAKINVELESIYKKEWYDEHKWEAGLELCWCFLQDGRSIESLRIAKQIENMLPADKEAEWKGLMSKIYLEQSEFAKSIEKAAAWEEALHRRIAGEEDGDEKDKDIDRLKQSHLIRMNCYHQLGLKDDEFLQKAIEEADAILDGTVGDVNALLEMSAVYNDMHEYDKCMEICEKLLQDYRVTAAFSSKMEAGRRQLDAGEVVRSGNMCIRYFPDYVKPYEYIAKVYLDLERKDDMEALMELAAQNGIKSDLLEAYHLLMTEEFLDSDDLNQKLKQFREKYRKPVENGNLELYEEGLPVISDYLYHSPESYMFVERGIFHRAAGKYDEAEEDINKALSLNPINPYALNAMSFIYKYRGDFDRAISFMNRAILYKYEDHPNIIYSDMADLYALAGDYEKALEFCMLYVERAGENPRWMINQMADIYTNLGQSEKAAELYAQYYEKSKLESIDNSADSAIKCHDEARAEATLEKWASMLDLRVLPFTKLKSAFKKFNPAPNEEEDRKRKNVFRYYIQRLWADMVFHKASDVKSTLRKMSNYDDGLQEGKNADMLYACILIGDTDMGKVLAKKMQLWLANYDKNPVKSYNYRGKGLLQLRVLAGWFDLPTEELAKLLAEQENAEICHFCTSCMCRELECLQVLLLLRQGKVMEARERMRDSLRRLPSDEFMLALKNMRSDVL